MINLNLISSQRDARWLIWSYIFLPLTNLNFHYLSMPKSRLIWSYFWLIWNLKGAANHNWNINLLYIYMSMSTCIYLCLCLSRVSCHKIPIYLFWTLFFHIQYKVNKKHSYCYGVGWLSLIFYLPLLISYSFVYLNLYRIIVIVYFVNL